jgi:glycosyltransferase involved in cell wall biosynthesis
MEETKFKVGVITRTKDRPLMLERAAQSVLGQTYKDFVWVIVNDGGDAEIVDRIAEQCRLSGIIVYVVHHDKSYGRPAAANKGIEACNTEYLLLHDDDDSLDPTFLEKTVRFLENEASYYNGVVTFSDIVEEIIDHGSIRTTQIQFGYEPKTIGFLDLFVSNMFPPIAFLFSRQGWIDAGKFDEDLNCTEDWFFNIQYLSRYSIGVLPSVLAHYHVRVTLKDPSNIYSNTIIAEVNEHHLYKEYWTNRLIREDIEKQRLGLGQLNLYAQLYSKLDGIQSYLENYENGFKLINKLGRFFIKIKKYIKRGG